VSTLAPPPPPAPLPPPPALEVSPPAPAAEPPVRAPESRDADHARELPLRLIAFAALAVFCGAQYLGLVAGTSGTRMLGLVAVATLAGAAVAVTARLPGGPLVRTAVRLVIAVIAVGLGLAATGVRAKLLLPAHWDEFGVGLDHGFEGLDSFRWPYDGSDAWVRLTLRLVMPLLIVPAALLAFWPARRRIAGVLRFGALALLLALYGIGVTERSIDDWALRGTVLLVLIAAWLWLPRLRRRDAARAAVAVAACGLLAVPLAASFDGDQPWIDYRTWDWFSPPPGTGAAFNWNHSYGPIRWSRSGETLLSVKSKEPHYWKAETLDRFDGLRWFHSESTYQRGDASDDIPDPMNPRWDEHIKFSVRNLRSGLIIGAGTTYRVEGSKITSELPDGTVRALDDPLESGDDYEIDAYVPDPSAAQMREAPPGYPTSLIEYTAWDLPAPGVNGKWPIDADDPGRRQLETPRTIAPDLPGFPLSRRQEARVLRSPYERTYRLARRLGEGKRTTYDTVKAVETYLQRGFEYSENPPLRRYPLPAFLFIDKIGYCQQFSGAMALMLRMNGIPARVAGGFTPGFFDHTAKEYRVRDLDAHSWVEVWFTGIGWVPFDPTPSLSPASSQSNPLDDASAARGAPADHGVTDPRGDKVLKDAPASGGGAAGPKSGAKPWVLGVALGALLVVAIAVLWLVGTFRRRRHLHHEGAVEELRAALARLGYSLPARTTLTELERRLGVTAGPGAARYVALLREQRYAPPGAARAPTAHDRGELRKALTAGNGPVARLRGLIALPPHPRRLPSP
jgi:transglutaminase-like putative cysteine protease